MQFDRLRTEPCIVQEPPPPDPRCDNADFALANPDICGNTAVLILKPAVAILCLYESVQFRVFNYYRGIETELTDATFTSSNPTVLAVGVNSGLGTAVAGGTVTVTVTHSGLTATATIQTIGSTDCCDEITVATGIVIDTSSSSAQAFGGAYNTRLDFAKYIAEQYTSEIAEAGGAPKDAIKVWTLDTNLESLIDDFSFHTGLLAVAIGNANQSANKTDLLLAFTTATDELMEVPLIAEGDIALSPDRRVLIVISDGEHSINQDRQAIFDAATAFKQAGGIVIGIGLRASGLGYELMQRVCTPGYFLNALPSNVEDIVESLNYLKSLFCGATCIPVGDEYVHTPEANYSSFNEFEVTAGIVNLLGPGYLDLLPDNGLYVEMNGGTPATIRTIDSFPLTGGNTYLISFKAAGNQRESISGQTLKVYLREAGANDTDANIFEGVAAPAWNQGFQTFNFAFVAPYDVTVKLYFKQLYAADTAPVIGNLLDEIKIQDVSTLNIIFADDFDEENPVYVNPDCGPSAARQAIADPDEPTVELLRDTGTALATDEVYQYAISFVTHEGETAASVQTINFPIVTTDNGVVIVRIPSVPTADADRVTRIRLWRNLGDDASMGAPTGDLYLLTELDIVQTAYLDEERRADFLARYDNSVLAPTVNTTAVAEGALGFGYADCCDYYGYTYGGYGDGNGGTGTPTGPTVIPTAGTTPTPTPSPTGPTAPPTTPPPTPPPPDTTAPPTTPPPTPPPPTEPPPTPTPTLPPGCDCCTCGFVDPEQEMDNCNGSTLLVGECQALCRELFNNGTVVVPAWATDCMVCLGEDLDGCWQDPDCGDFTYCIFLYTWDSGVGCDQQITIELSCT